jgi:hypothetical protein
MLLARVRSPSTVSELPSSLPEVRTLDQWLERSGQKWKVHAAAYLGAASLSLVFLFFGRMESLPSMDDRG